MVAVAAGSIAWNRHRTRKKIERLAAEIPSARSTIESVATTLDGEHAASRYLVRSVESALRGRLDAIARAQFSPSSRRYAAKLPPGDKVQFDEALARHAQVGQLLAAYNEEYLTSERSAHHKLLRETHALNDEQIDAVLKDDSRNLVIAGAGAGKTRVLIARMEYLTKRKAAVRPHKILAVTYTRQAAAEIQERLATRGIKGTHASTLHSLGKRVVGVVRGYDPDVLDEGRLDQLIRDTVDAAKTGKDASFADLYLAVLATYFRSEREDVPEQPPDQLYRTLKGKRVKSFGERIIADHLFLHGIPYEHEEVARWAPRTRGKGPYKPDFHLVKHGTYIEHWGINEQGQVPAWFTWTREQYREKMEWARSIFAASEYRLIETYDYERRRGELENLLATRLKQAGIDGKPLG